MDLRKRAPMYVTDHGHRGTDMYDVGFPHEDLLCFLAYFAQESFVEQLLVEELLNARVEVKGSHRAI
jgi:hypothetical protein